MKLMWGATQIGEVNGTQIAPSLRKVLDTRYRGWAVDVSYPIRTFIRANGQADCKTKMDAIEVALLADGRDLLFQNDDGSNSTNSVLNAATLGGTRCEEWKWEPEPRGAQFTTGRFLSATFEYRVLMTGLTGRLLDYSETLEIVNADPKYAVNEAVNGVAAEILQTVALPANTATQQGYAVGATAYPNPATVCPDIFVAAGEIRTSTVFRRVSPKARGATAQAEEFRLEWVKTYVSNAALVAVPNPWPAGT